MNCPLVQQCIIFFILKEKVTAPLENGEVGQWEETEPLGTKETGKISTELNRPLLQYRQFHA